MKNCAVIVETRFTPNLVEIIKDRHLKYLPKDWQVFMILGEANYDLIGSETFENENGRRRVIKRMIEPFDISDYNNFLTSVNFWNCLVEYGFDKVLIFQTDSRLLRTGVEDYLQWDFVGAQDIRKGCEGMMNGGLSIRDVKACLKVCQENVYNGSPNEDWWFCQHLRNLPPTNLTPPFSVELAPLLGSLGAHAIEKYLTEEECNKIYNQYK